ncbi:UNVERIFIED_CONTAM: BTB/POZ domain-containing protein [Sesamum radiatum]|uniref:BTB/POZ domain-containing protein n=1 Tax=Sesamum radiatum TaxID=300843 RepID=A0AAW2UU68_SESRA
MVYDFDSPGSPKQSSIIKVSKLLDNYLAEVALDSNMTPSKFIALAEILPDHARMVYDGLYRAVDIFLKVHPNMKDSERYRLCKTIDCQKLLKRPAATQLRTNGYQCKWQYKFCTLNRSG